MCKSKWKGYRTFALLLLAVSSTGYAAKYELVPAKNVSGDQADVVEDAMQIQHLLIFPNIIGKKITEIAKQGKPNAAEAIQNLFCDGRRSRTKAKLNISLMPPIAPKGIPIDKVAKAQKRFIELAQRYLQERYLFDSADRLYRSVNGVEQRIEANSDYDAYKKYVLDTGGERQHANRFSIAIPVVPTQSKGGILSFYKDARFLPNFDALRFDKIGNTLDHAATQFLVIYLPGEDTAVMLPKSTVAYKAQWGQGKKGTEIKGGLEFFDSNFLERTDSLQNFYQKVNFAPSATGWKFSDVENETLFPLQYLTFEDLAFLVRNYTFRLPLPVAEKLYGKIDDPQYFGHESGEDGKLVYSASLGIQHRDYQWEKILSKAVTLTQSDQPDKTVSFSLSLSMDLFCKYGVAVDALSSQ